jgi:S1-C subfamily serine protease
MRCPKCGHEQDDQTQCEACGIYFAKFAQYLQHRQEREDETTQRAKSRPLTAARLLGVVLLLALVVSGVIWFSGKRTPAPAAAPSAQARTDAAAGETPAMDSGLLDLRKQLADASPATNEIERVRNATVLIQTPWGAGSGFFVSSDCRILTNKHVIKIGDATLSRVEDDLGGMRRMVEEMRAAVAERKKRFYDRCANCDEAAYRAYMGDAEQQLAFAEEQLQKRANLLTEAKLSEPRVVLADGSEHAVSIERESTTSDLALLRLNGAICPAVSFGDDSKLAHGETLYTVGNPIGLKLTVTSGIFSGHYRDDRIHLLQTDAPINPGNSGGPLFDKQGRVVGINTMVAARAQGIGFAIPASVAAAEFGL